MAEIFHYTCPNGTASGTKWGMAARPLAAVCGNCRQVRVEPWDKLAMVKRLNLTGKPTLMKSNEWIAASRCLGVQIWGEKREHRLSLGHFEL